MTKLTLGVGANAMDVEDGAKVPMKARDWNRDNHLWATLRLFDGVPVLKFGPSIFNVDTDDGTTSHRDGWHVDLPALRRELAPKPVDHGGWTTRKPTGAVSMITLSGVGRISDGDFYWTHRPGNTPARQAAFDEAVAAWLYRYGPHNISQVPEHQALIDAALELGYPARAAPCA